MKKDYKKLYDSSLGIQGQMRAQGKSGYWHNARGKRWGGFWENLKQAFDVFIGRADALYWEIDLDK